MLLDCPDERYFTFYFILLLVALSLERHGILTFLSCWKVAKTVISFVSPVALIFNEEIHNEYTSRY
ncbi:hypothetical protein FG064_04800 [Vibrio cholerae]|uniref:Uncharacterized protein n=1 Tax=Vibrio cholerae TaxID=666 RepID=A0ABD7SHH2_VIBCL|nr:hypothetical protein [Vibrio cholerae]TXY04485.1 hypothetical protein FXF05_07090 [Vibrio mimicus]EGQ9438150.1 hypothetical protein [Vibrio cholerae]EGQ9835263.1 hypothetical protein [Vibrio cholerae]EGQ9852181.1 hypothetical protein [Vibrio cholerae]